MIWSAALTPMALLTKKVINIDMENGRMRRVSIVERNIECVQESGAIR